MSSEARYIDLGREKRIKSGLDIDGLPGDGRGRVHRPVVLPHVDIAVIERILPDRTRYRLSIRQLSPTDRFIRRVSTADAEVVIDI
jgi:hypothetical protein